MTYKVKIIDADGNETYLDQEEHANTAFIYRPREITEEERKIVEDKLKDDVWHLTRKDLEDAANSINDEDKELRAKWVISRREFIKDWPKSSCEKLFVDGCMHMYAGCYCKFLWGCWEEDEDQ